MDYQIVVGVVGALALVLLFIRNWRRSQARLKALRGGADSDDRPTRNRRIVP